MSYITTVTVQEITMAAPDIICLRVRDQEIVKYAIVDHGSPDVAGHNAVVSRTEPTTGLTKTCTVIGPNADHYKFFDDMPSTFLDRAAATNAANYPAIGGKTVTAVYLKSKAYDQGLCYVSGAQVLQVAMEHFIFLKLNANLPQGGPYTISVTGNTFPATPFTFDDRITRAEFLHATQLGHRPAEKMRIGYLAGWIPGYGTEGRLDIPTDYSLPNYELVDIYGATVPNSSAALVKTTGPTDAETGIALTDYPSTTVAPKHATGVTVGNPTTITLAGHGYSNGQKKFFHGFAGLLSLVNSPLNAITVVDANSFTVPVDTTGSTYVAGTYSAGYDSMVYDTYSANVAATTVYKADYSNYAFTNKGYYRIRVPGLGVSDLFLVDENVHYEAVKTHQAGYYNQISGIALQASVGGWDRPVDFYDGVSGCQVFESLLPAFSCSETGTASTHLVSAELSGQSPWLTANRVTGFGISIRDAGDWDYHPFRHCRMAYDLVEYGYRALPSSVRDQKFGFPLASVFIDPMYSPLDAKGDTIHMALAQLDVWRRTQKTSGVFNGMVYGGMQFDTGGGGSSTEPSYLFTGKVVALAGDPLSNMIYATSAAKMAHVLQDLGLTTLSNMWRDSAIAAFNWAENLYQDYLTNGATGAQVQAYFVTALNIKVNAGWSDPTFATVMSELFTGNGIDRYRLNVAAVLYAVTGDKATWGDKAQPKFASGDIADGDEAFVIMPWEMVRYANTLTDYPDPSTLNGYNFAAGRFAAGTGAISIYGANWLTDTHCYYTTSTRPYVSNMLLRTLLYNGTTDLSAKEAKMLCCTIDFALGANQVAQSGTIGIGVRTPNCSLIRDREAMGVRTTDVKGASLYFLSFLTFVFFNFGVDGTLQYMAELTHGDNEATNGSKKLISPIVHNAVPVSEAFWDNSFVVAQTEFTTQETIVPMFLAHLWRHCYDGNQQSTQSIRRVRRTLTAAA